MNAALLDIRQPFLTVTGSLPTYDSDSPHSVAKMAPVLLPHSIDIKRDMKRCTPSRSSTSEVRLPTCCRLYPAPSAELQVKESHERTA